MSREATLFDKPLDHWLAEYRRMEQAVATKILSDGGRVEIGDVWVDLLPITENGQTEVHIVDSSSSDLTLPDVYHQFFGGHYQENGTMLATDTLSRLHQRIDQLSQEIAELKRPAIRERNDVDSPYYTAEEAADYLRMTVKALYSLVERRKLRPLPGHRRYRFTREALDAFLNGNGR